MLLPVVHLTDSSKQSNSSNGPNALPPPTAIPTERPAIDSYFEKSLPQEDHHFDEIEKTTEEHIKYAKSSVQADQGTLFTRFILRSFAFRVPYFS